MRRPDVTGAAARAAQGAKAGTEIDGNGVMLPARPCPEPIGEPTPQGVRSAHGPPHDRAMTHQPPATVERGDRTALLVIDMLNDYDHDDGEALKASAREVVPVIASLIDRARSEDALVIHVNDNHGMWDVDRRGLIETMCARGDRDLIEPIVPREGSPFLFKARHSVFFGSSLQYLLDVESVGRLVLTGQVAEQCILYSALDAYIRHYRVVLAGDAVAHIDADLADAALTMMERNMRAELTSAHHVSLG